MADELDTNFFENEIDVTLQRSPQVDDEDDAQDPGEAKVADDLKQAKKLKRKLKFEQLKAKKQQRPEESAPPSLMDDAALTPRQQLELLLRHQPGDVGVMDKLSENYFLDLSKLPSSSEKFSSVIQLGLPDFSQRVRVENEDKGSPTVIVVCSSAIRSAEVINSLSKVLRCKIGKMFAKHFKIQVFNIC